MKSTDIVMLVILAAVGYLAYAKRDVLLPYISDIVPIATGSIPATPTTAANQVVVNGVRFQRPNRYDSNKGQYFVDYTQNGYQETVLSGSHIPIGSSEDFIIQETARAHGWASWRRG